MTDSIAALTSTFVSKHRTTPVEVVRVPNCPKKLVVYRIPASSFWWVRCYVDGKVVKRSTKEETKAGAIRFAKQFYDEIMLRRAAGLAVTTQSRFDICAVNMQTAMSAQVAQGEIVSETYTITDYRLKASVLPHFGQHDVADIHYEQLESYLAQLSHQQSKLSLSTIQSLYEAGAQGVELRLQAPLAARYPALPCRICARQRTRLLYEH